MKRTLVTLCAVMVAGTALAIVPAKEVFVPAVGHGLGAVVNGVQAHWRADVWIYNPVNGPTTAQIFLLLRNQANPNPVSQTITLNAFETRYLPDIVFNTFGLDNTFGALHIVSPSRVVVSGTSYDANVSVVGKGQGTAGQGFAGIPASLAVGYPDLTNVIGLDQDGFQTSGAWRSNLALVETTGNPVDLTIDRVDSAANLLGSIPFHLEGFEATQINYVVTDILNTTGTNQRIRVAVTGGTGRVLVDASRVDNRTGDPSTLDAITIHTFGFWDGVVADAATGTKIEGGIEIDVEAGAVTTYSGVGGMPCGASGTIGTIYLPFGGGTSVPIASDGSFSVSFSQQYVNGTSALNTNWTLAGQKHVDGHWTGTLKSDSSGGAGLLAGCNATGVTRPWVAYWGGTE
jgi:hypothetical protein